MNNVGIFLNNKLNIVYNNRPATNLCVAVGGGFLTPVRYLFNGNEVTISVNQSSIKFSHEKAYGNWNTKRTFLGVIASIIFLIPGVIIGSALKGLGYLSHSVRNLHQATIIHYTPVDRTIGSPEERLDLEGIKHQLITARQANTYNQPTKNLIIYAQEGTEIKNDPGILSLEPQKLIMVGAKLIRGPSAVERLDDALSDNWEKQTSRVVQGAEQLNSSLTTQWKMPSLEAALNDVPPRKSLFSSERYRRIYVI